VAAALALWGAEVLLARLSSVPQGWLDMGLVLLAWLGCALLACWLRRLGRSWSGPLAALLAHLPLLAVTVAILGPCQRELSGLANSAWGALMWGGPLLLGLGSWRCRGEPTLHPAAGPLAVLAAALAAWSLDGWPGAGLLLGCALACACLAALAWGLQQRAWLALLLLPLVLLVGRWPSAGPTVRWSAADPAPQGPDLLLLTVDTLRADTARQMRSYQRLAGQGAEFLQVQASSPWTLPSMGSLFTGLDVAQHGARRLQGQDYAAMDPHLPTLASALQDLGYDTAAVVAPSPYLGERFGFDRGFAVFEHLRRRSAHALPRGRYLGSPARPCLPHWLAERGLLSSEPQGDADALVTLALRILQQRRERPLFLWLHFLDPHLPYQHAFELDLPWSERALLSVLVRRDVVGERVSVSEQSLRAGYRHEVEVTDRALERLLDALGEPPPRGRIAVLTADHGEEFFEHGGFEHGHSFYQEVLAVPLVLAGSPLRGVVTRPVGLVDLASSLLELAGMQASEGAASGLLQEGLPEGRYVARNLMHGPAEAQHAVRQGDWKAIFGSQQAQLFDLESDPGERRDLAPARRPLPLQPDLHEPAPSGAAVELEASDRDQLRALGYLD